MSDPRSAQPGSYRTSGQDAAAGSRIRLAALSGEARARAGGRGAASPAGWSPPPAGEAAPPVRHRGPARSGGTSSVPEARWLSLTRTRPRHVPVVGPTEPLRGRPARSARPGMAAPRGAPPGLPNHQRRSSWQLAHQVWQDAGVAWEAATATGQPGPHEPGPHEPGRYEPSRYEQTPPEPTAYGPDPYEPGPYEPDPDAPQSHEPQSHEPDPDEPDPDEPQSHEPQSHEPDQDGYRAGPRAPGSYPGDK